MQNLPRRDALKRVTLLAGGAVATPTLLSILQACEQAPAPLNWQAQYLSEPQARLIMRLADMIIPETDTPGATQAGVHVFIDTMLDQCLKTEAQDIFTKGLERVEQLSSTNHQSPFMELDEAQQTEVLTQIADKDYQEDASSSKSFFKQLKELTLMGYFTSEMGAQQALAYLQIPGRYDGCTELEDNQKAWAL